MQGEKYLKLLSAQYPDAARTALEIIKLSSVLNLPKSTEHFVSDIHGEAASFLHVLKSGSGSIRKKIDDEFSEELTESEKAGACHPHLLPRRKAGDRRKREGKFRRLVPYGAVAADPGDAQSRVQIFPRKAETGAFVRICLYHRRASHGKGRAADKEAYYNGIIQAILGTGRPRP